MSQRNQDRITKWVDLPKSFKARSASLLLGNGASVAISSGFNYGSLYERAVEDGDFSEAIEGLFEGFKTRDFELVLLMLRHSMIVSEHLGTENDPALQAYRKIRTGLISAVRSVHEPYHHVACKLKTAVPFLQGFSTVLSLNYDLLLYWAIIESNKRTTTHRHLFKDCFMAGSFDQNWERFRDPIQGARQTSLVFFPHGNLMLAEMHDQGEVKVRSTDSGNLLDRILHQWGPRRAIPIFVSEGESAQKERAIQRSSYLNTVLYDVIPSLSGSLVAYGWSVSPNDTHILKGINNSGVNKVAFSIYDPANNFEDASKAIRDMTSKHLKGVEVFFFDASEQGVWCHA